MANFILRVQLSIESNQRYTLLRDRLINIGFTKRVKSKEGTEYRLPNGNYRIESNKDIITILSAVQQVAATVDPAPQIFIVEAKEKGTAWAGLQQC
jgi:hypothetical protein